MLLLLPCPPPVVERRVAPPRTNTSEISPALPRTVPRKRSLPLSVPYGLRQVLLLGVLYVAYALSRTIANGDIGPARHRATDLLSSERLLHLDVESRINPWVSADLPVALGASYWYSVLHYLVTPTVLVALYRVDRPRFRTARNALILATIMGLVGYLLFPTAPPRLMPGTYVDTLNQVSQYGWWSSHASAPAGLGGLTNELAAMPSLHVGWAVWVSWVAWSSFRRWSLRLVGVAYAVGTSFVVIGTGNHWVLDVLAGVGVTIVGAFVASLVRPRDETSTAESRRLAGTT